MKSLNELYRIGLGPSSSHTMGPRFAAQAFAATLPANAARVRVTLYGSLAATGRGHLTDRAVSEPFGACPVDIVWLPERVLPRHHAAQQLRSDRPAYTRQSASAQPYGRRDKFAERLLILWL